jgi:hypothetical protein
MLLQLILPFLAGALQYETSSSLLLAFVPDALQYESRQKKYEQMLLPCMETSIRP